LGSRALRRRSGRLAVGVLVATVVTALVLAVPVVSGAGGPAPSVALDSSSSSSAPRHTDRDSPVVMGRDGRPVPSGTFAGAGSSSSAREESSAAPGTTGPAPAGGATTGESTTSSSSSSPAPESPSSSSSAAATTEETVPVPPVPQAEAAQAPAAAAPADAGVEGQVLALVNAARAQAGCNPLAADAGLAAVARAHSADMRDRDFFDHVNPDGLDSFDRTERAGLTNARAENIAYGQPDAAAVMADWMTSRGHRANILDCELRTLGVGVAQGSGGPWWTQLFGV
jgi:uncharacterized protein YkwD